MKGIAMHAKSIHLWAFLTLTIPVAAGFAAEAENLLASPGFEQGANGWKGPWDTMCSLARDKVHSGASSAKIVLPEGTHHVVIGQTFDTLSPGKKYMAGGWSKSDGGTFTYFIVWFYDKNRKELTPAYRSGGLVKGAHPWTKSSLFFRVPTNAVSVDVQCGVKRPAATAWFDDLYLKQMPDDHVENHVVNSSFEIERTPGYPVGWNRQSYKHEKRYYEPGYWGPDTNVAYHGSRSLKVAAPLLTRSIWCKSGLSFPCMLSIYLKSNRENLKCRLAVRENNKTVTVGTTWKRYSLSIDKCRGNPVVSFTPQFPHESADLKTGPVLWADAAQMEIGESSNVYTPDTGMRRELFPPKKGETRNVEIRFSSGKDNMFPANGLTTDGQPIIPYWVWGLTEEHSAQLKGRGINCVFSKDLDKSGRLGLKVCHTPGGPRRIKGVGREHEASLTRAEYLAHLRKVVSESREHPALLGWFLCDEPSGKITPDLMADIHRTVKTSDPAHPAFLNWGIAADTWKYPAMMEKKFEYGKATDIFCGDPYPVPYRPVDSMARMTDAFTDAAGGKPVFMVPQFFGDVAGLAASPTPEEETAMIYLSLIHGTRGFCFYNRRPVSTPLWESMLRAGKELETLTPIVFSTEPSGLSGQVPDAYATGIHCLPRKHKGKLYLVTVNGELKDIRARFEVPGLRDGAKIRVMFEDRTTATTDGAFSDTYEPYERHVYEVVM